MHTVTVINHRRFKVNDAHHTDPAARGRPAFKFGRAGIVGPLAAAVVLAVTVGVAMATGGSGTIHSCYAKSSGQLRVVTGTKCHKRERSLTWNQTGPQGNPGPKGTQGPPGP